MIYYEKRICTRHRRPCRRRQKHHRQTGSRQTRLRLHRYRRHVPCGNLETPADRRTELAGKLANEIRITFRPENAINRVFVDGTEVTDAIRTAEVTGLVSKVAAVPEVRTAMTDQQRRMGAEGGIVMDGRDIGTVVFPDAQCKIFLTATVEERARRRGLELEAKGEKVDYKKLQEDIAFRDKQDSEREVSPLRQAEDAIYLDTSAMNIEQVTDKVLELVKAKQ